MWRVRLLGVLVVVAGCTPKPVVAPTVSAPKFPDFVAPTVPPQFAGGPIAASQDRGWRFLQAGDLKNAEREFALALRAVPSFFPAEAGLGFVELARQDARAALPHFDRVLAERGRDVAALVGRGQTLLALDREAEALAMFEAALAVDPALADVGRRVEVLRFRGQQEALNKAREAARAGRLEDAAARYTQAIAASPESPFLYRELAAVERQLGDIDGAMEHFRRAVELDPEDVKSLVQVGEMLQARDDFEGAAKAYSQALALGPDAEVEGKLDEVRARIELARLPEQYRAIDQAVQVTRADLAALVGVRLGPFLRSTGREAVLITDIRTSWAATWILLAARAGIMDPFDNHAFQPNAAVRRVDLAQVASRLLDTVVLAGAAQPRSWESARVTFTDLAPGHLAYPAASAAVASGVMTLGPNDTFQPAAPVSGREAIEAINRIEAMARGTGAGTLAR